MKRHLTLIALALTLTAGAACSQTSGASSTGTGTGTSGIWPTVTEYAFRQSFTSSYEQGSGGTAPSSTLVSCALTVAERRYADPIAMAGRMTPTEVTAFQGDIVNTCGVS